MIEYYCCSKDSKLGEEIENMQNGEAIRVTESDDSTKRECMKKPVKKVKQVVREHPEAKDSLMICSSLPCTGGCPWNHINAHQKLFKKLLQPLEDLCAELSYLRPSLLFELPTRCE